MTSRSQYLSRISRQSYWAARTLLAWGLAAAAFIIFSATVPHFFSLGNMYALFQIFAVLALLATGLGVVMLAAEFDLSIVGIFPLSSLIVLEYADAFGLGISFTAALLAGVACGLLNGWAVGRLRIPSIAVTVGTMMLTIGLGFLVSHNNFVSMRDYTVSLEFTRPILSVLSWQSIVVLAPVALIIAAVKFTRWGRYLYATGGDSKKARASGLPVTRTLMIGFVLSASCAALGGAAQAIALASSTPGAKNDILLESATAVLIGGIALSGGRGSLVGAVGGAFLLSVVNSGLGIAGTAASMIELVSGLILIGILALDRPLARFVRHRAERLVADDHLETNREPAKIATSMESAEF
jgi:ribose transport system permease protein